MRKPAISYWRRELSASIFSLLLLITIVYLLVVAVLQGQTKEGWNITEWLINYQGGFVRRGLPGEMLYQISHHFGITPYYIIVFVCLLLYVSLTIFFCVSYKKKGYSSRLFPYLFFFMEPCCQQLLE
jgi:hypothetical protein